MTMYPLDYGETAAAFAAGTRAAADRYDSGSMADPMGGATGMQAETTQQPHVPPEPADGGVT